jgi:hypothetical protein
MSAQLSRVRRPDFERDLLTQLAARWGRRAVIKQDELDLDGHYDPDLPDFPENLAPVLALPGAGSLDDEARGQILAAAWICYNAKTAAVEDEIVLPACRLMLDQRIPVRHDQSAVAVLQQTIIDEHYHILMCHNAAASPAAAAACTSWISTRTAGRWCEGWTSAWPAWPARPVT